MNIVVIDSGLSMGQQTVSYLKSVQGITIMKSYNSYLYSDDYADNIGHGTIIVIVDTAL